MQLSTQSITFDAATLVDQQSLGLLIPGGTDRARNAVVVPLLDILIVATLTLLSLPIIRFSTFANLQKPLDWLSSCTMTILQPLETLMIHCYSGGLLSTLPSHIQIAMFSFKLDDLRNYKAIPMLELLI